MKQKIFDGASLSVLAGMAMAATLAFSGAATAGVMTYNGGAATDVDTDPATDLTLSVPAPTGLDTGIITDVNVSIEFAGTVFWDDMGIQLTHVNSGTFVDITLPIGSGVPGLFDVTFDDEIGGVLPFGGDAVGTFATDEFINGSFPGLPAFNGLGAQGDWQLSFLDESGFVDGDDLMSWSLTITTADNQPVSEPATLALLGTGLLGLGLMRRRRTTRG